MEHNLYKAPESDLLAEDEKRLSRAELLEESRREMEEAGAIAR